MIEERPLQPEALLKVAGQRADAPHLGGVVSAQEQVDPPLLRVEEVVVLPLAGDEGVQPRPRRRPVRKPRATRSPGRSTSSSRRKRKS